MTPKECEFQNFINEVTEIRNVDYEAFVRLKYLVDGVLLAKSNENCKKACEN